MPSGCGVPVPPAKWSPSSTVITNSVFDLSIPCALRSVKKWSNAASYAASCCFAQLSPGPCAVETKASDVVFGTWQSWMSER